MSIRTRVERKERMDTVSAKSRMVSKPIRATAP
jgi:hypothetical protein